MFDVCMKQSKEAAMKLIDKVGVKLTTEEKDLEQKPLLKVLNQR